MSVKNAINYNIENWNIMSENFPSNTSETAKLCCIAGVASAFITKEKLHFSLICSFYCCLMKKGWALKVA